MANSDAEWEKFGKREPYWGVCVNEKFKIRKLTAASRQEFFESGEKYIQDIFETILSNIDRNFSPSVGVDFGCGVGRVVIPLSKHCKQVIGVDVSPSMLKEAKRNCTLFNITNADFVDDISKISQKVDFINTVNVLQHIEKKRGMKLIVDLVEKLSPSGIACIQIRYLPKISRAKRMFRPIVYRSRIAQKMYTLATMKDANIPFMTMNEYDVNKILKMLSQNKINKILVLTSKCDAFLFITKSPSILKTFE